MMKKMIMALCIFICVFTLVACSGQQTNESLTLGVNAIITEIDKENKIITTKDSGEEGVLGDDCLIDCSQIPMIYCNYDTQDVVDITLDDLQVGDEIILAIRGSEIENLQKEDSEHPACHQLHEEGRLTSWTNAESNAILSAVTGDITNRAIAGRSLTTE